MFSIITDTCVSCVTRVCKNTRVMYTCFKSGKFGARQ